MSGPGGHSAHGGPCSQEHHHQHDNGGDDGNNSHHHHHDHDHDGAGDVGGEAWNLYTRVYLDRVVCLNEAVPNSARHVLRPWHQRFDRQLPVLRSDADEQLLLCIPFVAPVKIKSICVIGGGQDESPATMVAFVNIETLDFDAADATTPTQRWDLAPESISHRSAGTGGEGDHHQHQQGQLEYPTRFTKFQNVSKLWLYFPQNFGAPITTIQYIGLKGEYTRYKREAVQAVYESRPLAAPKKLEQESIQRMGM